MITWPIKLEKRLWLLDFHWPIYSISIWKKIAFITVLFQNSLVVTGDEETSLSNVTFQVNRGPGLLGVVTVDYEVTVKVL